MHAHILPRNIELSRVQSNDNTPRQSCNFEKDRRSEMRNLTRVDFNFISNFESNAHTAFHVKYFLQSSIRVAPSWQKAVFVQKEKPT